MTRDTSRRRTSSAAVVALVALVALLAAGRGDEEKPHLTVTGEPGPVRRFQAATVAVFPGGSMLVGGIATQRTGGCSRALAVLGLDVDGRPDGDFGRRGWLHACATGSDVVERVGRLVLDRNGRALLPMTFSHFSESVLENESLTRYTVERVTPTGSLDAGFGRPGSGLRYAVLPDGSLFDDQGTRYRPDGSRAGRTPVGVHGPNGEPVDVATQPDGGKLFLGRPKQGSVKWDLAIERFDAGWRPDSRFGDGGIATVEIAPAMRLHRDAWTELRRVLPAPGGKAIAFGRLHNGPSRGYAFAIRLDARGRPDRSFGDSGYLQIGATRVDQEFYDAAVDGGLAVIGSERRSARERRWFVARYRPDGTLDRRFGQDGTATLPGLPRHVDAHPTRADREAAIAAGPGHTLVGTASVTGQDAHATDIRSLIFRLRSDGGLDPGFARRGWRRL